jgi:anti-sigma regulatory factor (Ser/Thr protein kinase)
MSYLHEAFCYSSDEELLAVTVPFLMDGRAAGEPALVTLGDREAALVRAALPAASDVEYLPGGTLYSRPATAIRAYRHLLADRTAAGAPQIRVVGAVPSGPAWDWWARYEAATNHAYDEFPLWSLCVFDRRTTSADMLAEVERTHPRTASPDGTRAASLTFVDPASYLAETRPMVPDPLEATPPLAALAAPTPGEARAAVRAVNDGVLVLGEDDLEDLVVAVSEAVTNAVVHGAAPVALRIWAGAGRMVVAVTDAGPGPKDPFAGLLAAPGRTAGGRGLWIVHQSCNHVTATTTPSGFTLRMTAGRLI